MPPLWHIGTYFRTSTGSSKSGILAKCHAHRSMQLVHAFVLTMPCKKDGLTLLSIHLPSVSVSWHFPGWRWLPSAPLTPSKDCVFRSFPEILRQPSVIRCRGGTNGLFTAHERWPEEPQRLVQEAQRKQDHSCVCTLGPSSLLPTLPWRQGHWRPGKCTPGQQSQRWISVPVSHCPFRQLLRGCKGH